MKIIWHESDGEYFDISTNAYRRFRKNFALAAPATTHPSTYQLSVACSGKYLLHINGRYLQRGPARYDRRWPQFDLIDISDHLRAGNNTIAVLCLYEGYGTGQSMVSPPGLAFELVAFEDGNPKQTITFSDESCKSNQVQAFNSNAPRINGRKGGIEIFDARLDEPGWFLPEFDDNHWPFVRIHKHALDVSHFWNLSPRDIPFLQEARLPVSGIIYAGQGDASLLPAAEDTDNLWQHIQKFLLQTPITLAPQLTGEVDSSGGDNKATLYLCELDKMYAGYLQIHANGKSGQIIDCIYLEALPKEEEGKFNLEGVITAENRPIDRFILQEGDNHFEVAFGWKAFRYVLLIIHPGSPAPTIKEVSIRTREYPFYPVNSFNSSDLELNQIFDICQHTARICAQDAFVDSPSREQQQWIGDGRWTALTHFHLTGDSQLYRRMLVQIGQSQDYTGMIKPRHPDDHNNIPPIPAFALNWISAFYEYFLHTGDLKLAREWWPNITHLLDWFRRHTNNDGLLSDVPGWFFIDWGHPPKIMDVRRGGIVAALNFQYIEALLFAAEISGALGNPQQSHDLHKQAFKLQEECRKQFWNQDLRAYVDCVVDGSQSSSVSEQTNALALLFLHGSGPYAAVSPQHRRDNQPQRVAQIVRNVFSCAWKPKDDIEHSTAPVPCSPFYMIRLLQALSLYGEHHLALDILKCRYSIFLQADSTTTWEKWCLYRQDDEGNQHIDSASHGWGASPILFLFNELLGISPLKPGYKEYSFKPHLAGMAHLSGEFRLPDRSDSLRIQVSSAGTNFINE